MDIFSQLIEDANFGRVIKAHGKEWVGIKRYQRWLHDDENGGVKKDVVYWLAADIDGTMPAAVCIVQEDLDDESETT